MLFERNWKNGKIFFYLSILFVVITIGLLFFDIRTITQDKRQILNSTLRDLVAMMSAFMALWMIIFTKYFETKDDIQEERDQKKTKKI